MGERAFSEPATADGPGGDEARAGATRWPRGRWASPPRARRNHETADRRPVASRVAEWSEVRELVRVMGDLGGGIFEIAGEDTGRDLDRQRDYLGRLRDLAVETGVPVTWGMFSSRFAPGRLARVLRLLDETARAGGRMFAQVHSRALAVVLSFETRLPFDRLPEWREVRRRPLDEQRALLRDADVRRRLVKAAAEAEYGRGVGAEARKPDYDWIDAHGGSVRAAPVDRRDRARARRRPRGGPDPGRAGARSQGVLRPAAVQREPRRRAGDDEAPALGGDVLRFRRARVPDHGLVAADAGARLLGAPAPGASPSRRACGC